MPRPQASATSSTFSTEVRVPRSSSLDGSSLNPKDVMIELQNFSILGSLHSKVNFLHACLILSLIPVGLYFKWSEQTGFKQPNLEKQIKDSLQRTSFNLLELVFSASQQKIQMVLLHVRSLQNVLSPLDWSKGLTNYQFIFNMSSSKHQKKLETLQKHANL